MGTGNTEIIKQYEKSKKNRKTQKRVFDSQKKTDMLDTIEAFRMARYLSKMIPQNKEIVVVGIGSPDMTGDILGPLTGLLLRRASDRITIYGTSYNPVDASNINACASHIRENHKDAFILAIDATIGERKPGKVIVTNQPIKPAAARNGEVGLAHIGDVSIMGVVATTWDGIKTIDPSSRVVSHMPEFIAQSILLMFKVFRKERIMEFEIMPGKKRKTIIW